MSEFQAAMEIIEHTPAVAIDIARTGANIDRMAALARDANVRLRPHIKTHKMVPIARMQVEAGAAGITVAKLGEAEVMAAGGITDILVAYPIVGASNVERLMSLAERTTVSVALDSLEVARPIATAAHARGLSIPVMLEIDTGLHRLGVLPDEHAIALAAEIAASDGLRFAGIFTHEGHAYTDSSPDGLRNATLGAARAMAELAARLRSAGLEVETASMGSSATARYAIGQPEINEFRPGTYVFNDRTQIAQGAAAPEDCAAAVIATVISHPRNGEVVIDAGSKSLTSDRMIVSNSVQSYGCLVSDPSIEVVRIHEEHGVLRTNGATLNVGDRVAVRPNHICPVINLHDRVFVFEGDEFVGTWAVDARGRSQ
jgi:D-serine deaminase-like pyridoxal phosphate-dependent protein